jgi:hypothetical protein
MKQKKPLSPIYPIGLFYFGMALNFMIPQVDSRIIWTLTILIIASLLTGGYVIALKRTIQGFIEKNWISAAVALPFLILPIPAFIGFPI